MADVDIPKMDGLELLKRIKKDHPHKICILMSGKPAHENEALAYGADAFLAKPFDMNALFEIVQTFVVEVNGRPLPQSMDA